MRGKCALGHNQPGRLSVGVESKFHLARAGTLAKSGPTPPNEVTEPNNAVLLIQMDQRILRAGRLV